MQTCVVAVLGIPRKNLQSMMGAILFIVFISSTSQQTFVRILFPFHCIIRKNIYEVQIVLYIYLFEMVGF